MSIYIADDYPGSLAEFTVEQLVCRRLTSTGPMLDAAYQLFERQFDAAVLDSKETYLHRMSAECLALRDFLPCYVVGYFESGSDVIIAGFISSDVMWIDGGSRDAILAVGNIATSKKVRKAIKGVGTRLLSAALEVAQQEAAQDGRRILYVATEAEVDSLEFWLKAGFRWPRGLEYYQPPLEFDERGDPLLPEEKERFMLAPVEGAADRVSGELVRRIVATMYENWCLRDWRTSLSAAAMARAEGYVRGVFERVTGPLPAGPLELTDQLPKEAGVAAS